MADTKYHTLLITGGAGFIGSCFIRMALEGALFDGCGKVFIINLDALTYAGNLENLAPIEKHPSYRFIHGNIQDSELVNQIIEEHRVDAIINFAAESHVDRSISDSRPFIDTNVAGTLTLLEAALKHKVSRFLQVSTDEVYGSLGSDGKFTETTPLAPNSPYSASKASADLLVRAFVHTFGLDAVITRCSNNYGPYQFPEKLIPLMISNALADKELPVYGKGINIRDWIHVEDHCRAIWAALSKGKAGEVYNIGSNNEWMNIDIVKLILKLLGKPESLIKYVKDRPGHDMRYAIDSAKSEIELGWKPQIDFATGIEKTIMWYVENSAWRQRVLSGEYMDYYEKQYGR
jgi:dTDP-glucose 4,6-dehydratase